jgi:hypothetical protein
MEQALKMHIGKPQCISAVLQTPPFANTLKTANRICVLSQNNKAVFIE